MIRANLEMSTQHLNIVVNGEIKTYCAYCGKEIAPDVEIDHYERTIYHHCDCEDALKEIEIRQKLVQLEKNMRELQLSMPKTKYTKRNVTVEKIVKI